MASPVFHDYGESVHQLTFEGTSADEILDAKLFWESLQLIPPHESRLVSDDVVQRLKVSSSKNMSSTQEKHNSEATVAFLKRMYELNKQDQQAIIANYLERKKETVALFEKQKTENRKKEALVSKPVVEEKLNSDIDAHCMSPDYLADLDDNPQKLVRELNNNYGRPRNDSDSD